MIQSLIRHAMLAMLMLGMGASVVHAAEPTVCIDGPVAAEHGHEAGDGDEVPGDAGKGYPHHHASCSGHHLADEVSEHSCLVAASAQLIMAGKRVEGLPSLGSGPALRPPIT
ncbi:MAG: hypothetical protein P0Y56_15245 [Candidatus Andeanibacterium colombiense]|uniref:Uncharacterized protein n=1 Tax=Candidatus Andeanibacterium colombiense TaxID=3121345 RepID=A0AAJ5X5J8_9SPHN|nr:MAG: hypothetical protein P0Y56_15245 [Sphingomonadaceae bacterium]